MPRCARSKCRRWRPDIWVRLGRAGFHLDGAWFCSLACLELAARARLTEVGHFASSVHSPPPLRLGVLLVHQGAITTDVLRRGLDEQRRSGLRLGRQLRRMGLVSSTDVLRSLAAQAGVGYLSNLDPARLREAPREVPLPRHTVRALGLIPFETDVERRRLKVACLAPLPRLAIGAVRELTGWSAEPYLVADEQWDALMAAYGADETRTSSRAVPVALHDIGDAAARVAEAARGSHDVRMAHARCDPYMWVRLEGNSQVEDLLLKVDEPSREVECLEPPTSH